ncbi:MAG TPA: AAA family ATPase [Ignavibacteria bacterium]|nr:AAA family ATPase [Ignavibacteria bacterium]
MQNLYEISNKLINRVKTGFKRSLYSEIDWQQRLIEITGARGVGKTTLMLQKAKELFDKNPPAVIYISLDDTYFFNNSMIETAEQFQKYGGKYMFIDEVHKYPAKHKTYDWSAELKNIYDRYPELSITYSGSSIIELYKGHGDLSRRKTSYKLNGMSFREYLEMNNTLKLPAITLQDVIDKNPVISADISDRVKILPHFRNYLSTGYYPFYNENPEQYNQRIKNIINVILEVDIPSIAEINYDTTGKIKTMLAVLSTSVPYTPNLTKLSDSLQIGDIRTLYKYFYFLEKAELITLLNSNAKANKLFQKPEKIYLSNTNLINAISPEKNETGTIRETFFLNQLHYLHEINYPKKADFIINNKYTFEIGGKNKTEKQIKNIENSYIVQDDIEIGFANKIPLWLFGFLY